MIPALSSTPNSTTDAGHFRRIQTVLPGVLPPSLPLASIGIKLTDVLDASARRHRGVNQLSVGRPCLTLSLTQRR